MWNEIVFGNFIASFRLIYVYLYAIIGVIGHQRYVHVACNTKYR